VAVGILVHGDNHFIVRGPKPDLATAAMLIQRWSVIQIGAPEVEGWRISSREFREDLEWAIVAPGAGETSRAVRELLAEMRARGIEIRCAEAQQAD
jgi:hypothetical protein